MADDDELELTKKVPKTLIAPASKFKIFWNLMILTLIIFLAVIVPYRIPFEDNITNTWLIIDCILDTIFFIDIILNFNTAYEDD
jgi:hypothetical protein